MRHYIAVLSFLSALLPCFSTSGDMIVGTPELVPLGPNERVTWICPYSEYMMVTTGSGVKERWLDGTMGSGTWGPATSLDPELPDSRDATCSPYPYGMTFFTLPTYAPDMIRCYVNSNPPPTSAIPGTWSETYPPFFSEPGHPVQDPYFNGKNLYFTMDNTALWVEDYNADAPVNLRFFNPRPVTTVNSFGTVRMPWVNDAGNLMILSGKTGTQTDLDLYYAVGDGTPTGWSSITKLPDSINTAADEQLGRVSELAGYLYFARTDGTNWTEYRASITVVPEPSTFALLAVGAIGLLGWARRRRRSP